MDQAKGTTQLNLIGLLGLLLFLRLLLLGQIHDTSDDPEDNIGSKESYMTNIEKNIPHKSMMPIPAQSQDPNFVANL